MAKEIITIENLQEFKTKADETYQPKGDYATKNDIPDVSELTEQVAENTKDIEDLKSGEGVDLSDYAKTAEIEDGTIEAGKLANALTVIIDEETSKTFDGSEGVGIDLSGYATAGDLDAYQAKGDYVETTTSTGNVLKDRDQLILQRDTGDTNNTSFIAQNASGNEKVYFGIGGGEQGSSNMGVYRNDSTIGGQWLVRWDKEGAAQFDPSHSYGDATHPVHFETGTPVASTSAMATTDDLASYAAITAIEDGTIVAGTASKLGSSTIGSATTPIYLSSGAATACSDMANALTGASASIGDTGATLTFSRLGGGTATATIPLAGDTAGLMSKEDKERLDMLYSINATAGSTLETTSWTAIALIAAAGDAQKYWKIGDTKTITLTTGEEITVRIIGFDHDASNSITFEMVDCLNTRYSFNSSNVVTGGWDGSALRSTLNGAIFDTLPPDLQSVIRTVSKKRTNGNSTSSFNTSSDKLFLLALAEMYSKAGMESSWDTNDFTSTNIAAYCEEGDQYEYYKEILGDTDPIAGYYALWGSVSNPEDDPNWPMIKYRGGTTSTQDWWYSSVGLGYSTYFWCFYCDGVMSVTNYASYSNGVSFAFCV